MQLKPLVTFLAAAFAAPAVWASASGVVISQVYGGGGNTGATYKQDFIELFNAGSAPVAIGGWSVQYASATGSSWTNKTDIPAGTVLQPGRYFLIREGSGGTNGTLDVSGDIITGAINLSGTTGKVALVTSTTVLSGTAPTGVEDIVSYGTATSTEGTPAPGLSNTTAALRTANGCTDTNSNSADFSTGTPTPRNGASPANLCAGGGTGAPIVTLCPDATVVNGVGSFISVSASDADNKVSSATKIDAPNPWPASINPGAFVASGITGAAATQEIAVAADTVPGTYPLTLQWTNDGGQTASCNFKVTVTGLTPIYAIQGSGAKSPFDGQTVSTSGVVTKLNNNGFFMQDPIGDGNPATSDGIFVFTSTAPTVSVGQSIRLSAKVSEFNVGAATNADTLARTVTELTTPTGITLLGSGYSITPVEVDLATLPADGLEAYEGMLVTLRGPLMAQQNFFQGRFGQVTLAAGGRVNTPTNVLRPGPDALALKAENARRSILLDDGTSLQNVNPAPYIGLDNTLRAGDTIGSITGVIDYGLATSSNTGAGIYKIHPLNTAAVLFDRTNPRVATPQVSGGNIRVASANVLNFFTSFTDGKFVVGQSGCLLGTDPQPNPSYCRGADNATEFERQVTKTVAELTALNADVVGLMEIQNSGDTTVNYLVGRLNAVLGAGTYASVPLPAEGTGTDAIRVAMIYKPGQLTLNGASISDPDAINNRPPLAQGFKAANGEKFAVVVNHFKSKSSCPASASDPDADDGLQGCWNARRVLQTRQLKSFLSTVQSTAGTSDVVLLGDFNAYAQEDPIDALTQDGSIVDAVGLFDPLDYSYVFDGAAGRLDHGFATASLVPKLVYATSWHVNADEPEFINYNTEFKAFGTSTTGSPDLYSPTAYRASDHDPMVMGLRLVKSLTGTSGRDTIVGTPGDDIIEGGPGADTLTGNGGRNQFVYGSMLDAGDVITDFTPGMDTLVLTRLLASLGIVSADPLASGHVTCTASGAGAVIGVDADGAAGPARPKPLLQLRGVACSALNAASYKF